ncbi:MAG: plasmid pRiA4b ORF-3 family protein [Hydrococcus sp. SU_1_0]|nr:plasmid pRiA4b ORF-3 family protein [Hydrococcus sp. SU_1_0]
MESKFAEITALTDAFCSTHLNAEYGAMSRKLTAALCRKRPSPLVRGKAKTWACGVVHALGMVNFLYDSSQTPHMKATELCKHFGVGQSTGQGKSKEIRDLMKISYMSRDWCLPSRIEDNPLIWMVSVNGLIMDIRNAPREIQVEAFEKGFIPYLPGDRKLEPEPEPETEPEVNQQLETKQEKLIEDRVYVLEVFLISGNVTEKFIEQNPVISRIIEIRSEQTLKTLHQTIFKAFDREEEHMYEFQVGGKGPFDPKTKRYGLSMAFMNDLEENQQAGDVAKTKIGSLKLKQDQSFGYWFDFGDDWRHQIDVMDIKKATPKKRYPLITKRIGASPPQYVDWDEED